MNLSIILSTFNRAHLLVNSIWGDEASWGYGGRLGPNDELIIINDGSEDNTNNIIYDATRDFDCDVKLIVLPPSPWRDCAATYNLGIRLAHPNNFCILTHPEIIPGPDTLYAFREAAWANPWHYICAKGYYLTIDQQAICERNNNFSLPFVRSLPDFYTSPSPEFTGNPDYTPSAIDANTCWESLIFGGLHKSLFKEIGGMWESDTWGTVDVTFMERRKILNIPNLTLLHPDTFVIHQNHDTPHGVFVPTNRDMKTCLANVPRFLNRGDAICHNL